MKIAESVQWMTSVIPATPIATRQEGEQVVTRKCYILVSKSFMNHSISHMSQLVQLLWISTDHLCTHANFN